MNSLLRNISSILNLRESTIDIIDDVACNYVNELASVEGQCLFVRTNGSCAYGGVFFSYTEMTYCGLGSLRPLAIVVLLLVLLILFVAIASVADDFLCPSLLTISKTLRLPEHIAGVTFLALGNAAPDVFSSISGLGQGKPHLMFASLFGGGIFITTIVTGTVLFAGDFSVMMRPMLRDICFYIGAGLLVWIFVFEGTLHLAESISLIGYYGFYIVVVIIGRYIYVRMNREQNDEEVGENAKERTLSNISKTFADIESDAKSIRSIKSIQDDSIHGHSRKNSGSSYNSAMSNLSQKIRTVSYANDVYLSRFYRSGSLRSTRLRSKSIVESQIKQKYHPTTLVQLEQPKRVGKYENEIKMPNQNLEISKSNKYCTYCQLGTFSQCSPKYWKLEFVDELKDFSLQLCPIDIMNWSEFRWYRKLLEVVKAIPFFIMTLCIPVVDIESPNENWCRLLVCLNVVCAPQTILFLFNLNTLLNHTFPLWVLILMLSLIAIVPIYLTSEPSKPPIYNRVFAFIGFAMSVVFINAIADEVVEVLSTFGIMFDLSDSILGLTVLAWGNSLGDLIADNSLARHGHPGIAIAACFGGPLLNMVMGVGLPYTILFVQKGETHFPVEYSKMMTLLIATLLTSLLTTIGFMVFNKFKSSKIHGTVLIVIYLIYVLMAILIEFGAF